jgi:hypothetical protein
MRVLLTTSLRGACTASDEAIQSKPLYWIAASGLRPPRNDEAAMV